MTESRLAAQVAGGATNATEAAVSCGIGSCSAPLTQACYETAAGWLRNQERCYSPA